MLLDALELSDKKEKRAIEGSKPLKEELDLEIEAPEETYSVD